MFTVKLSASDFSNSAKWTEIVKALKLPAEAKEAIVMRIPGLLPVDAGMEVKSAADKPPPEWLLAEDTDRTSWWVVHTGKPRFIAEIADEESLNPPFEYELDGGEWLCNFLWYDQPPEDMTAICEEVNEIVEYYDQHGEDLQNDA